MKIVRKILLSFLVIGGILVVVATILGRIFEDEITQYVVSGLNQQIRAEAKVDDVKLSFLKKFPDATLELKDVVLFSVPGQNTDTLLQAKRLFLRFNLVRLLKRQYMIREVHVHSGKLNLLIDKEGNTNYIFWNQERDKASEKFLLDIDNLKLTDIIINYDNRALDLGIHGDIRKITFKGNFSREAYKLSTDIDGFIYHYTKKGNRYFQDQKISSSASLSVDPQRIEINLGNLILAGQHLSLQGHIIRPKPLEYNLSLTGEHLDLEKVLKFNLLKIIKLPEDMKAGGDLAFNASITGLASKTKMPRINANFTLLNGWLKSSQIPSEIREFRTEGNYTNGNRQGPVSTRIKLNNTSFLYGNSRLGGIYEIVNLTSPRIDYTIKAELDLADIQPLIPNDSIFREMSGILSAEIHLSGNPKSLAKFPRQELLRHKYDARIRLEGINLGLAYKSLDLKNLTGDLVLEDYLMIKSMNGSIEDIDLSFSGRADNFLEFMFTQSGNLWLDADVYVNKADLNKLASLKQEKGSKTKADTINLPDRLYVKARYWFDELTIKKFHASQVTGELIYKPRRLSIPQLNLHSFQGKIETEGILEQNNNRQFLIKSISEVSNLDINGLFTSFGNFGQDFIMDEHIKGSLSGLVNFSAGLNKRMKIKKETILADCDVVIQDGELSGFDPMMKLSRFIDVEELENIKFSTLTNQIFIRNEEVIIPKMDISSSAFDITGSGIHGFDKNFTYKVKLSLSELLSKKARKPDKQESEFGVIEDDGLGRVFIYLIMEGSGQGMDVRYDRRGAMQDIRDQFREEKIELKEILNEEFGLFKKDSTLRGDKDADPPPKFIIEWDEDTDKGSSSDSITKGNKSDKERFTIVWDDDEEVSDTLKVEEKKQRRKKKK